jgi:glycosyltransferase involved in cell wall biosynthesis
VSQVAGLRPIICVDDGSIDRGASLVMRYLPDVEMVRLEQNQGKTEAIRAGMHLVRSEYVCLLDADLRCLTAAEIEAALTRMVADPGIDMIIMRRVNATLNSKITRGDVLFSGERFLRTRDLARVLNNDPEKDQLEIAINQFMLDQRKRVYWMPSSAKNTFKVRKTGWRVGLERDMFMIRNMLDYGGLGLYIKQFFDFATERAPNQSASALF